MDEPLIEQDISTTTTILPPTDFEVGPKFRAPGGCSEEAKVRGVDC